MTKIHFLYLSIILSIALEITSCIRVEKFTTDETKWFRPYNKTDTIIFISKKNELDTIIFYKKVLSSDTIRNLGQGFYNINYLTVSYKPTKGSYHQFALMSDGKTRYGQEIINISKSSSSEYSTLEITFLGTYFDENELGNIEQINKDVYYFDSDKATYHGVDVEKGIKNFTFDTKIGIVNYTDDRNIEWKRK